jgi:hypothetical protein
MSNNNKASQAASLADVQALIAGTQKHLPNGQFTLGGTVYTTASLVEVLQGLADAYAALVTAHATVKDAIGGLRTEEAKVDPVLRAYVSFVRATFANATAQLGDFGLQAPKARLPMAPERRLAATAKAKATRIARGTVGKKQKLAIHGDVTGVLVTPITASGPAPSPTASTPAPAGATAPASTTTTALAVTVAK